MQMQTLELDVLINAPAERVFEVLTDLEGLPERVTAIQKIELLTEGPVGLGTKFRETRIMFKREASEEMEFTSFDPPQGYVLEAESRGARYTTTYRLDPENNGTRLSISFEGTALSPFARFVSAVLMPFFKGAMRRAVEADLENLKHAAEAGSE